LLDKLRIVRRTRSYIGSYIAERKHLLFKRIRRIILRVYLVILVLIISLLQAIDSYKS